MSVLARDLAAYNDALDRYRRQVRNYNSTADKYNQSLVRDDKGNIFVTDGKHVFAIDPNTGKGLEAKLPKGLAMPSLGRTQLPDDPKYSLLRQNPLERKTERITATFMDSSPQFAFEGAGGVTGGGYYYNDKPVDTRLYSMVEEIPGQPMPNPNYAALGGTAGWGQPEYITGPKTAIFERDASVYTERPGDAPALNYKRPDPTISQLKRLQSPSAVDLERGLVGEIIGR